MPGDAGHLRVDEEMDVELRSFPNSQMNFRPYFRQEVLLLLLVPGL